MHTPWPNPGYYTMPALWLDQSYCVPGPACNRRRPQVSTDNHQGSITETRVQQQEVSNVHHSQVPARGQVWVPNPIAMKQPAH
eukprot:1161859-Pelagomonas_calceolata.AAC.28